MGFLPETLERAQPRGHLDVSPVRLIWDFQSPKLYHNTLVLFQVVKFVVICHRSDRKLTALHRSPRHSGQESLGKCTQLRLPLCSKPAMVFLLFLEKKTKKPQKTVA